MENAQGSRDERFLTAVIVAVIGAGGFWDGLYSPGQQVAAILLVALAMLWLPGPAPLTEGELAALGLLALGVGLSLVAPASAWVAAHGPVVAGGWILALLAGRALAGSNLLDRRLARTWALVGPLMLFAGLVAMSYLPAHHTGRLASFVGYPIAVGMLGLLGAAACLPAMRTGTWWAPLLLHGNLLALVLSGSRGVWAVAGLLLVYLLRMRPALLRGSLWPAGLALVSALWAGPAVAQGRPAAALAAAGAASLTLWLLDRFQPVPGDGRWGPGIFRAGAALGTAAAALLAPGWGWLLGRATALPLTEGSSVERLIMLQDGLAMVRELPWGAGYRAWSALHLQGARYAYYSAEVHSAPVDLAIGFGWLGAAGFLLLLGGFWLRLRQGRAWSDERLVVLGGLGALGLHALLDWDLSYGLFALPLWLGFGLAGAGLGGRAVALPQALRAWVAGTVAAAVFLVGSGDLFSWLAQRSLEAKEPGPAYRHARMALAVTPWSDLAFGLAGEALASLGRGDEAIGALGRARELGPYEPWYAELHGRELMRAGRFREAAAAYRELTRLWPWEMRAYEAALEMHMEMLMRAELMDDSHLAVALAESGRAVLAALGAQKAREPALAPRKQMPDSTPVVERARSILGMADRD